MNKACPEPGPLQSPSMFPGSGHLHVKENSLIWFRLFVVSGMVALVGSAGTADAGSGYPPVAHSCVQGSSAPACCGSTASLSIPISGLRYRFGTHGTQPSCRRFPIRACRCPSGRGAVRGRAWPERPTPDSAQCRSRRSLPSDWRQGRGIPEQVRVGGFLTGRLRCVAT